MTSDSLAICYLRLPRRGGGFVPRALMNAAARTFTQRKFLTIINIVPALSAAKPMVRRAIQTTDRRIRKFERYRAFLLGHESDISAIERTTFIFTVACNSNLITWPHRGLCDARLTRSHNEVVINPRAGKPLHVIQTKLIRTSQNTVKRLCCAKGRRITPWLAYRANFTLFIEFAKLTRLCNPCKTAAGSKPYCDRASSRTRSRQRETEKQT